MVMALISIRFVEPKDSLVVLNGKRQVNSGFGQSRTGQLNKCAANQVSLWILMSLLGLLAF
jgi:hypothetical protein